MASGAQTASWPTPPFRTIRTDRLALRALSLEDAPAVHAVLRDPDSMRFWYHTPHTDLEQTRALMRDSLLSDDGGLRLWAITTDGGQWLGNVSLFRHGKTDGLLWLGYILAPGARGRGYAREAARAALAYAFADWGAHRVEANLDPENLASARLLEDLGFRREGTQIQNFRLGDEWKDTALYGLLADEWRARRAPKPDTASASAPDGRASQAVA